MHELCTFSVVFWLLLLMFADVSLLRHLVAQKSKSVLGSLFDSTKILNFCFLLYRPPWWPGRASLCLTACLLPPKYRIFVAMLFTRNKYLKLVPFYFADYHQDGTSLCQTACLIPPKYWIFVSLHFTHNKYIKLSALCFTDHPGGHTVQIPEGPFNPTNYSGTQINVWGAPPGGVWPAGPGMVAFGNGPPAPQYPTQYGFLTEQMIEVRMWHVQLCYQSPHPCWGLCLGSQCPWERHVEEESIWIFQEIENNFIIHNKCIKWKFAFWIPWIPLCNGYRWYWVGQVIQNKPAWACVCETW